ncbi:MAG: glycosyltransferase family 2 protein [Lachnospiraceae bacterium]|jgi:teichuronic acid biosynthesis glycosyltransferase TuaG|nr:glycosyltransferase family 2 protein [Lachnospiraceae bacterium]MCI8871282.1 glycosyltransferase family 2 protein [Lachnospiraceae bacterium]
MDDKISVSVIMPAYNAGAYIAQAIESVLCQKVSLELLVIDDCSADSTAEIVTRYTQQDERVILIRNTRNQGVAESRNIGIRRARGTYLAFLDADDWWQPGKLELQCRKLQETGLALCCTGRELMNADGSPKGKIISAPQVITYKMLLRTNSIACSSVVMRTEAAREFYMSHDELHEDYILWLNVLKKYGNACGIAEPMLKSRMSEGGKSRNKLKSARMHFGVYRLMGIGRIASCYYFLMYMFHGIRKYM